MGTLTLTAGTGNSRIVIDPNNDTSTTLTLGNTWTRGATSSLLIDYSSANTGTRQVVTAGATTGAVLTNGIYGWLLVKDSAGVTGFGTCAAGASQAITRFDDTTGTTLADNSNTATTNFTTLNTTYTSGTLSWSNGITTRSVNSLTIDTTNSGGTIDMGAAGNILTLTTAGVLFKGAGNETLTGGQLGAAASEVLVHQVGTGALTIASPISSGAGSFLKDGTGTVTLSGTNVYTGTTVISAGTLKNGSSTTFTTKGTLTLNSTGTFDLGGFNASFTNLAGASVPTNTITNSGSSDATLNFSALTVNYNGLITDGSTNKTAISMANNNGCPQITNSANSFSGGLTLLNGTPNGTRLYVLSAMSFAGTPGALTSSNFGTGTITIGQTATDKAGIRFDSTAAGSASGTLANAIVFNTALGTDRVGITTTAPGTITLSGAITANSNAAFAPTAAKRSMSPA